MSLPRYQHTQISWFLRAGAIVILLAALSVLSHTLPAGDLLARMQIHSDSHRIGVSAMSDAALVAALVVVAVMLWNFASLTVEVTRDHLRWQFGVGLPRRSVPLREIDAIEIARVPWWAGKGIHRLREGWLYNVAGRDVVRLQLGNGRRVLIGSDEAKRLAAALSNALPNLPNTVPR